MVGWGTGCLHRCVLNDCVCMGWGVGVGEWVEYMQDKDNVTNKSTQGIENTSYIILIH